MPAEYNIFFVPHAEDRRKISKLRSKVSRSVYTTQALQYPVHMSLVSGAANIRNFKAFEKELKEICRTVKPMVLQTFSKTDILPDRFWTGLHIVRTKEVTALQKRLQKLRNKYAKPEKHPFHPLHITFAYPARVKDIKPVKSPVKKLLFDRVTVSRKENARAPARVYRHVRLS